MKLSALLLLVCLQIAAQTPSLVFESGNFKGLRNQQGEILIPSVYDDLGWSSDSTEPLYDKIEPFTSGRFRVAVKGKFTNRFFYGLIDKKGKIILNFDYFDLIEEKESILVTIYKNNEFLMGALKPNLSFAINPNYQEIDVFENIPTGKKNQSD